MYKLYIILVFLLFQSMLGYTQFLVGESKVKTLRFLSASEKKFTESKLTDSTSIISYVGNDNYRYELLFNKSDTVIRQITILAQSDANDMIVWFNRSFKAISETEWEVSQNEKKYKLQLEYFKGEAKFVITPLLSTSTKPPS